jgi:hypothetical protein
MTRCAKRWTRAAVLLAIAWCAGSRGAAAQTVSGDVPAPAEEFLRDVLKASGNDAASVTSLKRTPRRQAELMLQAYERPDGLRQALALYGSVGDGVLRYYDEHRSATREDKLEAAAKMIEDYVVANPARTQLMHVVPTVHTTFDVAPSSLAHVNAFVRVVQRSPEIARVIPPGGAERAVHLELRKSVETVAGAWAGACRSGGTSVERSLLVRRDAGGYTARTGGGAGAEALGDVEVDRVAKTIAFTLDGSRFRGTLDENNTEMELGREDGTTTTCAFVKDRPQRP